MFSFLYFKLDFVCIISRLLIMKGLSTATT